MKKIIAFGLTMMMVLLAAGATFLSSTIPQEEREALIALYKATNGDKWRDNSGWKEEPLESDDFGSFGSEGNWKGITVSGNHVTKIELNFFMLKGILPLQQRCFYINEIDMYRRLHIISLQLEELGLNSSEKPGNDAAPFG